MPIDRDAALKRAEKLLRLGKLDGAIEEYVRLIDDQPRDWNSINALGDLYVRAGNVERAVAQFTRIADHLFDEGFFPKAAALYKKALRVRGDHEPTLLRLADIAAQQGLLADAKQYLRQLGKQRTARGDTRGAAECLVRLGSLEEADGESKVAAARAAEALSDTAQAARLFKEAADAFEKEGRKPEALEALSQAAHLDPDDIELRGRLARDCVAAGQLDRARLFLTPESAGDDPDLLLALARIGLTAGNDREARSAVTRLITVAPERSDAILRLGDEMAEGGHTERAFLCIEIVVDTELLGSRWDRAVLALQAFLRHAPHIPALMKLVEVAVDTDREDLMHEAQAQLADAYLDAGRGAEARVISEDLVIRDPSSEAHVDRLRRALLQVGVEDPEDIIRQYTAPDRLLDEPLNLSDPLPEPEPPGSSFSPDGFAAPAAGVPYNEGEDWLTGPGAGGVVGDVETLDVEEPGAIIQTIDDDAPIVLELTEIDLSDALAELGAAALPLLPPVRGTAGAVQEFVPPERVPDALDADTVPAELPWAPAPELPASPPRDLESVFEDMRSRASRDQQTTDAAAQYERGLRHLENGRVAEAQADLQSASRTPQFRFDAAARLGRLHVSRGELEAGVEWLGRAAEAPAPSADDGLAVLYDLAGTLEQMGETARALAVLLEIGADATVYRDVPERIAQLTRAQAGSHGS